MDAAEVEKAVKVLEDRPTLNNFIEQFGVFAQGPSGFVTLKRLILKLAVKGDLLEFESIDCGINRTVFNSINLLIKSKVIKKPKSFPEYKKIKYGWYETTLNGLGYWALGTGFPKKYQGETDKNILFVKVSDMNLPGNEKYITKSVNTIDSETAAKIKAKVHDAGTVIFPKIGGAIATNKRRIITTQTAIDNNCLGITVYSEVSVDWLYITLLSIDMELYQAGTSVPAVSQSTLETIKVGLPCLEEQKCIVAKVDELMELCDQLQTQQQQQANTLLNANTAAIHALLSVESGQTTKQKADRPNPKNKKQQVFMTDSHNRTAENTSLQGGNLIEQSRRSCREETFKKAWHRIEKNFHTLYGNTLPMPPGQGRQKKYCVGLGNLYGLRVAIKDFVIRGRFTRNEKFPTSNNLIQSIGKEQKQCLGSRDLKKISKIKTEANKIFSVSNNWVWVKFAQCVRTVQTGPFGSALHKNEYVSGGIPVINPSNLINGKILSDNEITVSEEIFKRLSSYKLCSGDIVLGRRGEMGRCAIVRDEQEGWLCGTGSLVIRTSKIMNNNFLALLLGSNYVVEQLTKGAVGITMLNIGQTALMELDVALPPLEEQKCIVAKVDQLMAHCDQLEQQLNTAYGDAENLINATIKSLVA